MDKSSLLYLVPLVIIAIVIVIAAMHKRQTKPTARREPKIVKDRVDENEVIEDLLEDDYSESVDEYVGKPRVVKKNIPVEEETDADVSNESANVTPKTSATKPQAVGNDLIVMGIISDEEHPYVGYELLQALLTAGLRYGKMGIFHRHEESNGRGDILFSLASAKAPGTFDLPRMGAFATPALSMFMRFSTLRDPLKALDIMYNTANQLVDDLGGEVFDDERKPLSSEKLVEWRERILNYQATQTSDSELIN